MHARPFMAGLTNPPSFVHKGECKFLIMDAPTDDNLQSYISVLKKHGVRTIVRACEPTYSPELLDREGMTIVDVAFPDGQPPSSDLIDEWLSIVETETERSQTVAVHCVAGLGRAPVLVAIALMEFAAMDALDAVDLVRNSRRGAINQRQFNYLKSYSPRRSGGCCAVL